MKLDHDTPIYKVLDLANCAVSEEVSFDAASRLKRSLLSRGWHNSDDIPEKELGRLVREALIEPVVRPVPTPVPDGGEYACGIRGCLAYAWDGNYCERHQGEAQ